MLTYVMSTVTAMTILTFVPQAQPFLLTEVLGIPEAQQGVVSGNIGFYQEIIIVLSIGIWGSLSDRIGRKYVFALGFFFSAIGNLLMPSATTLPLLYAFRTFHALGAASIATMLATIVADYAIDSDRGKASGIQGVGNGLGAMVTVFVLLSLPAAFQASGSTAMEAARGSYLIVAGIAAVSGLIMLVGLQPRTSVQKEQRESVFALARDGIRAARDPGVALAYAAAFVSRGDLAIVGTFFTLWLTRYGTTEAGMTAAEALKRAGMIIGIAQLMALISAPIFGWMADRLNRVTAVVIAVGISSIGYGSTFLINDPLGGGMLIVAAIIGLGEVGGVIASGVLIAQQSPRKIRGAIIGTFSFAGALGIMVATLVGGWLFDNWRSSGPFVLFAIFGVIVSIWGLAIRHRVVPASDDEVPAGP
jgi:MFS family permease